MKSFVIESKHRVTQVSSRIQQASSILPRSMLVTVSRIPVKIKQIKEPKPKEEPYKDLCHSFGPETLTAAAATLNHYDKKVLIQQGLRS